MAKISFISDIKANSTRAVVNGGSLMKHSSPQVSPQKSVK